MGRTSPNPFYKKEFCAYLGIRETKARELMTKTNNPYTIRLGNKMTGPEHENMEN